MQCETTRIRSEPSPENETGFVVINLEDFDPETMKLFDPSPKDPPAVPPSPVVPTGGAVPPWAGK